ncbi:MAG: helix-turn-helix transcriptional regulator [Patescibacteria group bacterium]
MPKTASKKIPRAIQCGDLIPSEHVLNSYSQRERQEISRQARYLKASTELRRLRKELGLSQNNLANKMRVKREFISRMESGYHNITLETLYRVAEVVGKKIEVTFK